MEIKFDLFNEKDRKEVRKLIDCVDQLNVSVAKQVILESNIEMATPKQIIYLKSLGFKGDTSKLTLKEASKEIDRLGG